LGLTYKKIIGGEIMKTVGDLRKIIENLPDDYQVVKEQKLGERPISSVLKIYVGTVYNEKGKMEDVLYIK
jgi:hypothetical protein